MEVDADFIPNPDSAVMLFDSTYLGLLFMVINFLMSSQWY